MPWTADWLAVSVGVVKADWSCFSPVAYLERGTKKVAALGHAATSGLAKPGRPSSPLGQRLDNTLETGLSATEGGPRTAI